MGNQAMRCGSYIPSAVFLDLPVYLNIFLANGQGRAHRTDSPEACGTRLEGVVMTATEKGTEATLMTWHRRLGHPSFNTVVD